MGKHLGVGRASFFVSLFAVAACGSTSRSSCPSDADCAEAAEDSDGAGDSTSGAGTGGSGDDVSDGVPAAGGSGGSDATDAGGSGGAVASTATGGSGGGGSGGSASGGAGGSATADSTTTGVPAPEEQTPGTFDCGEADLQTPLLRLTNVEYDNTVLDLLGVETLDAYDGARPSQILAPDPPDSITELGWEAYRAVAAAIAAQVMGGPLAVNFITCDPAVDGCLSQTITAFGRRAFRRPLSADEQADYESLRPDDSVEPFDETAETILAAMLASPSFLFRVEQGGLSDPVLTDHELASRLSYFLWGGPPDAALSTAADAGVLGTPEGLAAEAGRMLEDPRLLRSFAEFHRGYLGLPGSYWGAMDHDTQVFPNYSSDVPAVALAEVAAFLDYVVASEGSFADLFLSNRGFVNQDTAPLYGLAPQNYGSELVPVELDPSQRPGLLTRVGFLSSFSAYATTSPILRGIFVSKDILNVTPPVPDPGAESGPIPEGMYATNREYVSALTAHAECVDCHSVYINPSGFVLENYDAVGSWQTVDPKGGPIDPVADVFFGDSVETVNNSLELMQKLATSSFAQRNYADQVIAYALSRGSNPHDACLGDELAESLAQGVSLKGLWLELTQRAEFRIRGL